MNAGESFAAKSRRLTYYWSGRARTLAVLWARRARITAIAWGGLMRAHWPLTTVIVVAVVAGNTLFLTHYYNYAEVQEREEWVAFTQSNIANVLELSIALHKAVVDHGNYLTIGKQKQYEEAVAAFNDLPDKLDPVIKSIKHPAVQDTLAEVKYEISELDTLALRTLKARQTGNLAAAYAPGATESFFQLVDHIDANLDRVRINEQGLLNERLRAAEHSQSHYVRLMLAASLGSLLVVVISALLMLRLEQRKEQVEDQLRETRERLDLASRGAFDGIWDWDIEDGTIYLSPRLKEILGYKDQELANSIATINERMHPDDRLRQQELNRRYLNREVPRYEDVFRLRHRDGSWRWVMSRGIALWDERGKPSRMVGVHTDITSLKRMEEELRDAKTTADAANRAKTNFLANMSHEIRTPMNAIIGIAGILARKTPAESRDREYVEALNIASRSLFSLINDLLDLSKLGEGSLTLEQVPFDLRQLLEEVVTVARVRAEEKKIVLVSDFSFDLPPAFVGDPTRVRQIVTNLISNAVKFTEQGSVILRADVTPVGHLEIRVRDTGIGIPKDMQPHIFEKFIQSDSSITRRFGGTGLGLAISKELAELMGGEIDLSSEEHVGSEFVVTLPLPAARPQAETAPAPAEPAHIGASKGTVLLVEDYKPNILVVRTILGGLGFGCDAVSTGSEAAALLCGADHDRYSIALMDVQLPDMSGVEVTRRVRECEQQNSWPHLPIVAVTAHALLGDREKFLEAGMDAYIAKPFDPEDLAEKIATLVAGKPKRKPAAKAAPKAKRTKTTAA